MFVNGSVAAAPLHVGTGSQTLLSREEYLIRVLSSQNEIMHASSGPLNMFEQFSFLSWSCVYIHI